MARSRQDIRNRPRVVRLQERPGQSGGGGGRRESCAAGAGAGAGCAFAEALAPRLGAERAPQWPRSCCRHRSRFSSSLRLPLHVQAVVLVSLSPSSHEHCLERRRRRQCRRWQALQYVGECRRFFYFFFIAEFGVQSKPAMILF